MRKADQKAESGCNPDYVVIDETVGQLNDEQYCLYAAVDPNRTNYSTKKLEPWISLVERRLLTVEPQLQIRQTRKSEQR